jgi:hypothetical protein
MDPARTVREYYQTLRDEEPLYPYFREDPTTVKFGLSETLVGYEAIAAGLREQTRTTADWVARSRDLTVGKATATDEDGVVTGAGEQTGKTEKARAVPAPCAWFADDVFLAWTDTDDEVRHEFDTRWSGTLVGGTFATMHVSTTEVL